MRSLMFSLMVLVWALPGLAAQTFVVPITAVPGSVLIARALMTVSRQVSVTRAWRRHLGTAAVVVCFAFSLTSLAPAAAYGAGQFGDAVSISGDVVVVGAPSDVDNGISSGAAYVFRRMGATWVEEQKLLPHDGEAGDRFGYSVSVSGSADEIIVGAPGTSTGHVYMFRWSGSTWQPASGNPFTLAGAVIGDRVGHSVDVTSGSGTLAPWAVAGAPEAIANALSLAGKVQLFKADPDWGNHTTVQANPPEAAAHLGTSVSMSFSGSNHDGVLFAGQPFDDHSGLPNSGTVEIFEYTPSSDSWSVEPLLVASSQVFQGLFGYSVSVAGDLAIVGAPGHSGGLGRAFMKYRDPFPCSNCWGTAGSQLLLGSASTADGFGTSVSLSGHVAVVGSPGRQVFGRAYVYRPPGAVDSTWEQTRELLASGGIPGGKFGQSVAVSGETVVVGRGSPDAAYVFDLSSAGNPLEGQELLVNVPEPSASLLQLTALLTLAGSAGLRRRWA
jgi:hypothetical protein